MQRIEILEDLDDSFDWLYIEEVYDEIEGVEALVHRTTTFDDGVELFESTGYHYSSSPGSNVGGEPNYHVTHVWRQIERKDLDDVFPWAEQITRHFIPGEVLPVFPTGFPVIDPSFQTVGVVQEIICHRTSDDNGLSFEQMTFDGVLRLQVITDRYRLGFDGQNYDPGDHPWMSITREFDETGLLTNKTVLYDDEFEVRSTYENSILRTKIIEENYTFHPGPCLFSGECTTAPFVWRLREIEYNSAGQKTSVKTFFDDLDVTLTKFQDGNLVERIFHDRVDDKPWIIRQVLFGEDGSREVIDFFDTQDLPQDLYDDFIVPSLPPPPPTPETFFQEDSPPVRSAVDDDFPEPCDLDMLPYLPPGPETFA